MSVRNREDTGVPYLEIKSASSTSSGKGSSATFPMKDIQPFCRHITTDDLGTQKEMLTICGMPVEFPEAIRLDEHKCAGDVFRRLKYLLAPIIHF